MPGTRECVRFYRRLAEELRNGNPDQTVAKQDHRLLWMHLKLYFQTSLPQLLEEKGAVIVCEEYNQWFWPALDPDAPCVDEREHNEGQARTRLEAFLESLGDRAESAAALRQAD